MANPSVGVAQSTPYGPTSDARASSIPARVASIDILRGLVVVLMAIDHVRVFSAVPAGGPDPGVFLTRWVTNFVAPVFVFLAGTAAYLYGLKVGSRNALAKFLLTRGLLLVALELTIIRFFWTFNLQYDVYLLAGVIWAIGWSMVLLAALVSLRTGVIAAIGIGIMALHNVIPWMESAPWPLRILYYGGEIKLGANGPSLVILYSIIPWVGVMAAGFALGVLYEMDRHRRRKILLRIGAAVIALFALLRATGVYGDPGSFDSSKDVWTGIRTFLATAKYPASLQFLLMTLGPALLILPSLERTKSGLARVLEVFGRVPMFYYLLHIPLIHGLAIGVSWIRTGSVTPWLFANHPVWPPQPPEGYRWSLGLLYFVTLIAVTMLYFACRWYGRVKATSPRAWMKYV